MAIQGKQIADSSVERIKLNIPSIPVSDDDIATKVYVDNLLTGLSPKNSVRLSTDAALPSSTYDNGTSGVGATLTATANGAITIDGTTPDVGDRLLIKNQVAALQNGIYEVTAVGDGSNPFLLTRTSDFDGSPSGVGEIKRGDYMFTVEGTVNGGYGFTVTSIGTGTDGEHVVGTDSISFSQISQSQTYTAGNGLQLSANEFSVNAGAGLDASGSQLTIASNGVVESMINFGSAAGQVDATSLPLDTGGSYGGSALNVQDALEELETLLPENGQGIEVGATGQINLGGGNNITGNRVITITSGFGNSLVTSQDNTVGGISSLSLAHNLIQLRNNGDGSGNAFMGVDFNRTITLLTETFGAPNSNVSLNMQATTNGFRIGSTVSGFQGATYVADYSANYVDRSLPDVSYVNSRIRGYDTSVIQALNGGTGEGASQNGFALTWDNVSQEYVLSDVLGGITASNGITKVGNDVQLGGTLTSNTSINGASASHSFSATGMSNVTFEAQNVAGTIITQVTADNTNGAKLFALGVSTSSNSTVDSKINGNVSLAGANGSDNFTFELGNPGVRHMFTDGFSNPEGIKYAADYGATMVARSLIDKGNVELIVSNRGFGFQTGNSGSNISVDGGSTAIVCSLDAKNTALVIVNDITYIIDGNSTNNFYFSTDGGSTATTSFNGATLYFNAVIAQFNLSTSDSITIVGMVGQ